MEELQADTDFIARAKEEPSAVLAEVFNQNRDRLAQIVGFRLDQRLKARLDVDDILQEAFCDAETRFASFISNPAVSPFVWIRSIVNQTMIDLHRKHFGAAKRSVNREVNFQNAAPTSMSIAYYMIANNSSPSRALMREEAAEQLQAKIEELDPIDREIIALRHYEELSNSEVAEVMEITKANASVRYIRALKKLKKIMEDESESDAD